MADGRCYFELRFVSAPIRQGGRSGAALFILLGMFFGTDGVVKIPFDNFELAQNVCSVALLFIMFYGGFGTNVRSARPVAAQAVLLSSVGTVLTAGLVGVFCHFVLGLPCGRAF